MSHELEVMVALSESFMKKCVQRSLAEDWRWRHVRLAIKLLYLEHQASQIKRYYGSLSWNLGRLVIFLLKKQQILINISLQMLLVVWVAGIKQQI